MLTKKKVARSFLKYNYPKKFYQEIDFSSFQIDSNSFIDEQLRSSYSDILYKFKRKGVSSACFILVEHQSSNDKFLPLRIIKYIINILERYAKDYPKEKLPAIYPMILYNGTENYTYTTSFLEMFEEKEMMKSVFTQEIQLINLRKIDIEELKKQGVSGKVEALLKYAFDPDFWIQRPADLKYFLNQEGKLLRESITYFLETQLNKKEAAQMLTTTLPPKHEKEIMTIADALRYEGSQLGFQKGHQEGLQKGHKEGLQEGLQKGALESTKNILIDLLKARFNKRDFEQYQPLIKSANLRTLQRWIKKVLKTHSIEEVFS